MKDKNHHSLNQTLFVLTVISLVLFVFCSIAYSNGDSSKGVSVEAVKREGVEIWTKRGCDSVYNLDELLEIKVESQRSGYLTIFDLMPNGQVQILFPNRFQQDNFIQGGKVYSIPASNDNFSLRISPPRGWDQLLAVVTEEKQKLVREDFSYYSQAFPKLKDSKGQVLRQVKKGIEVTPDQNWWAADSCSFSVGGHGSKPVEEETEPSDYENSEGKIEGRVLIIGIASYTNIEFKHAGKEYRFGELSYSTDDARDMKEILEEKFTRVKVLLNEEATYSAIKKAVREWLGAADSDEISVFYFSGHGAYEPDMEGDEMDGLDEVLVPYDYSEAGTFIVDDELNDWFNNLPTENVLYIADSCHSGTSSKAVRTFYANSNTKSAAVDELSDSIGNDFSRRTSANAKGSGEQQVISLEASKPNQDAIEDPELEQGVFTHFLLQGLKGGADEDEDGKISVEDLFSFSHEKVTNYTDNRQEPLCNGCEKADFHFSID